MLPNMFREEVRQAGKFGYESEQSWEVWIWK